MIIFRKNKIYFHQSLFSTAKNYPIVGGKNSATLSKLQSTCPNERFEE